MTHLSTLELAAEVDRLVDPSALPEGPDAPTVSHLRDCAVCRNRIRTLREQDMALASMLQAHAAETQEPDADIDVSSHVAAMMKRLREDVAATRRASVQPLDATPSSVSQGQAPASAQHPRHKRRYPVAVLGFAAGVGFVVLTSALLKTFRPAGSTVALVPWQETIEDSVPGFAGKQYTQKVGAGSSVRLVVEGLNRADFDCELYDPIQAKPVAVSNGIGNSCEFAIVASEAGEYRLVLKNKVGASTSYTMVANVVSKGQPGAGRIIEKGALPDEPPHQMP